MQQEMERRRIQQETGRTEKRGVLFWLEEESVKPKSTTFLVSIGGGGELVGPASASDDVDALHFHSSLSLSFNMPAHGSTQR